MLARRHKPPRVDPNRPRQLSKAASAALARKVAAQVMGCMAMQRVWRGHVARARARRTRATRASVKLQSVARGFLGRAIVKRHTNARVIQGAWLRHRTRDVASKEHAAATAIQALWSQYLRRRYYGATAMQRCWRRWCKRVQARRIRRMLRRRQEYEAACRIQGAASAFLARRVLKDKEKRVSSFLGHLCRKRAAKYVTTRQWASVLP